MKTSLVEVSGRIVGNRRRRWLASAMVRSVAWAASSVGSRAPAPATPSTLIRSRRESESLIAQLLWGIAAGLEAGHEAKDVVLRGVLARALRRRWRRRATPGCGDDRLSSSGSSLEISRIAAPSAASRSIQACSSALAPTSTPRVGSSRIRMRLLAASHLASTSFCWLPPESVDGRRAPARSARTCSRSQYSRASGALLALPDPRQARQPVEHRQRGVLARQHRENQSLALAIFGHQSDAEPHRVARRTDP